MQAVEAFPTSATEIAAISLELSISICLSPFISLFLLYYFLPLPCLPLRQSICSISQIPFRCSRKCKVKQMVAAVGFWRICGCYGNRVRKRKIYARVRLLRNHSRGMGILEFKTLSMNPCEFDTLRSCWIQTLLRALINGVTRLSLGFRATIFLERLLSPFPIHNHMSYFSGFQNLRIRVMPIPLQIRLLNQM